MDVEHEVLEAAQARAVALVRGDAEGDTAVLHAEVTDVVLRSQGPQTYRMPVTQVWVRTGAWTCLAGHAGPLRT